MKLWRDTMIKKIINFIINILNKNNEIFYVGSLENLPEPLTKEEEILYVKAAEEGDTKAREILIEHNLRLVVFLAKKYENTKVDLEDLVSIGTIGLIKGVNTYKLDKNIKLATYASRCIDNEILMFLRKNKKRRGEISFEDSLSYDSEGNELHLEDILGTEKDIVTKGIEEEHDKKVLYEEINKLKKRDKEIMIRRYGLFNNKEMTQKDVADLMGISQSYISRIEKKVIKKIKTATKI
jgi:RNA polymerase sporulation-specific sigma factor